MINNETTRFIDRSAREKLGVDISNNIYSALMLYSKKKNDLAAALATTGLYISTVGKASNKMIVIPISMISCIYFEHDGDKDVLAIRILSHEYLYQVIDTEELKKFCREFKKMKKNLLVKRTDGGLDSFLRDMDEINSIHNPQAQAEKQNRTSMLKKLSSIFHLKRST